MFECNLWEQQNCSFINPIVKNKNYFMHISLNKIIVSNQ